MHIYIHTHYVYIHRHYVRMYVHMYVCIQTHNSDREGRKNM